MTSSMASHCDFKFVPLYSCLNEISTVFTIIIKLIELSPSNYTFSYIWRHRWCHTVTSSRPFIFMFEWNRRIFTLIPQPIEISPSYTCIMTMWVIFNVYDKNDVVDDATTWLSIPPSMFIFNSRPRQNGRLFAEDIFKYISFNENFNLTLNQHWFR